MCYPKPGPRCSAHAGAALAHAKQALRNVRPALYSAEYEAAKEAVEQAQMDYDATPAGFLELQRRIDQEEGGNLTQREFVYRLAMGKARREAALAALKAEDKGDITHDDASYDEKVMVAFNTVFPSTFLGKKNRVRVEDTKSLVIMNEASKVWVNRLSSEETEAVSWLTSNGAHQMNYFLANGEVAPDSRYSEDVVKAKAEAVASAIDKTPLKEPVVLYRGLQEGSMPQELYDAQWGKDGFKVLAETYKVGDEFSVPTFQSASLDPIKASSFARGQVVLEIKTRKAAPVSAVSAWDVTEREMVVQRGARFKVVGVKKKVCFDRMNGKPLTEYDYYNVVQLEEI